MRIIKKKISKEAKQKLLDQKETVYIKEPWTGYCDNKEHPRFTIKVDAHKPTGVCFYCSKVWKLKN